MPAQLELGSFLSLLEATFALNLAFSLIRQLHTFGHTGYTERREEFFVSLRSAVIEPAGTGTQHGVGYRSASEHPSDIDRERIERLQSSWSAKENGFKMTSERVVRFAVRYGFVAAMISLMSLALGGFFNQMYLPWWVAVSGTVLLAVPIPVVILWLHFYWLWKFKKLQKNCEVISEALDIPKRVQRTASNDGPNPPAWS